MQIIKFKNIVITILIIPIISCNDISQNKSTGHENQLFSLNNETNEIFMSKSNIIDRTLKNTNQNAPLAMASVNVAMTVSPAPETSNTSRARVGI